MAAGRLELAGDRGVYCDRSLARTPSCRWQQRKERTINLRQLRYFVRVVEAGNITRAAERLHVAQPSLGVQIRLLEEEIGVELLVRHSRGITPTEAGKLLYERASDILQRVDVVRREVRAVRSANRKPVVLGFPPSTMSLLGPDILADAALCAPDIAIEIVEDRSFVLLDALGSREVDIAIAYNVKDDPKIIRTPIFEEELIFVAAPSFFSSEEPVNLSEVLASRLALAGARGIIRNLVHSEADRLSRTLDPVFRIQSASTLKTLLMKGSAASILPYGLVVEELAEGTLGSRRIRERPLYWTLYFVHARGSLTAEARGMDRLLEYIANRLKSKLGDLTRPINWGPQTTASC